MNAGVWQVLLYLIVLGLLVRPLGWYMARAMRGEPCGLDTVLGPLERLLYRLSGVDRQREQSWRGYTVSVLVFSLGGLAVLFGLQMLQGSLPLNPAGLPAVDPDLAFNTAVSFVTNTNWQSYAGEQAMSHLTQMLGLTVQNFVSAAAGIAVLAAVARGLARRSSATIGNFWVDLTRATVYILLPLSIVLSGKLVTQGVVQTLEASREVCLFEAIPAEEGGQPVTTQAIAVGPAASQAAIKQLGTNGGGFFNANSAHPLENPTPFSNFLQALALLLIPASLCWTFGELVGDRRQGWAILATMTALFIVALVPCVLAERQANPALVALGVDAAPGNMEGKELRVGVENSALWAAATTAASNGAVNSMHDSYMPLGGLVPMLLMQLGEVVFGGVGSGLYGMLLFVFSAAFVAGLMVGRTPEYLGKKIEPFEMKMAALAILLPSGFVLVGAALAVALPAGRASIQDAGPHGFSEVLYALSSAANNNGSAFAGLGADTPFFNTLLALAMLAGRFGVMIPVLAIAGSMARKNVSAKSAGSLPTHSPLFVALLALTVILVGALTFVPALALGPVVEHLRVFGVR